MSKKIKNKAMNFILSSPINFSMNPFHMEMNGNREIKIEGFKRIIQYDEDIIKISTKGMNVTFLGRNLVIKCLTQESLIINGFIKSIEFFI